MNICRPVSLVVGDRSLDARVLEVSIDPSGGDSEHDSQPVMFHANAQRPDASELESGLCVCDSMAAMNKRKSSRITGVFLILFSVMPLLNSLSNPRLAGAHGSDLLKLIAVGLCFGIGACLLAGLFRFPGE